MRSTPRIPIGLVIVLATCVLAETVTAQTGPTDPNAAATSAPADPAAAPANAVPVTSAAAPAEDGAGTPLPGNDPGSEAAAGSVPAGAAADAGGFPIQITVGDGSENDLATGVKIVLLLTLLTVAPALLLTLTSFTRIIIVLSFTKRALAVQELPPNQIVVGLALFLTVAIMHPVLTRIYDTSVEPYMSSEISAMDAGATATKELSGFLMRHTREADIALMVSLSGAATPETPDDVPIHLLVGAFVLSELKTGFQMGFVIFLPFLVIDMVVAGVLLSMGMFMLPPALISTPFKILLFVLVDGWSLLIRSLMSSFG